MIARILLVWTLILSTPLLALAEPERGPTTGDRQPTEKAAKAKPDSAANKGDQDEEPATTTRHSLELERGSLDYLATAGTMIISKEEGDEEEPEASMFYVAYIKESVEDPARRPIVYCFNGGPGSSAVWLHLGGFGPQRVQMNADGTMPSPPFQLGPNPDSILRVADLVFIDPVSTGYSRADGKKEAEAFHGFQGDLDSMAEFIRLFTTRHERWLSPKFLAGESYGALRAAGLAYELQEKFGLYLNGLILVSGVLSFETLGGGDLSYVTFLPALSEVAAYHGQLEDELLRDPEARRQEVRAFARGEYASALLRGLDLTREERHELAEKISRYIGLDVEIIDRLDLRVSPSFFREELLKDRELVLGRFDARITAKDGDPGGNRPRFDPSYAAVYGPFSANLNDYVRRQLGFESDLVYEIISDRVRPWNYGKEFIGQPISVADRLARVLTENPALQVLVNCGYQDLATPCDAIRHSLIHLDVAPEVMDRIEYTHYEGGHMMYTIEDSNRAWNRDVARFIEDHDGLTP